MARRPALPAGRTVREGQSAVAAAHAVIDPVQPVLRAVSDLQDMLGLALLAVFEGHSDPWGPSVVPGGLDQQPASEPRPSLCDRPLVR